MSAEGRGSIKARSLSGTPTDQSDHVSVMPIYFMRALRPWLSAMATNAVIALTILAMMWLVGVKAFLLVHLGSFHPPKTSRTQPKLCINVRRPIILTSGWSHSARGNR